MYSDIYNIKVNIDTSDLLLNLINADIDKSHLESIFNFLESNSFNLKLNVIELENQTLISLAGVDDRLLISNKNLSITNGAVEL